MTAETETDLELRRKKLTFRAWHRGMKEMDIILGNFADEHLSDFDADALDQFEFLLRIPDQIFYSMLVQGAEIPPEIKTKLFDDVFEFAKDPLRKS